MSDPGPLDRPIHITLFPDLQARDRESLFSSPREFAERLRNTRAPTKGMLPLFSPCSYDAKRTAKKSLRHDANVRECFCVVGDYDREQVSFDDAVEAAKRAGIACVIVTTSSHTPTKPRWRVIAPLQQPLSRSGTLREHGKLTSWLAGIFPDAIHPESWTLSQSWYVGTIDSAPDHRVAMLDGDWLDQRDDLAVTARAKPVVAPKTKPAPKPRAPRPPHPAAAQTSLDGVVAANAGTVDDQSGSALVPPDIAALLTAISKGEGSHDALVTLAGKFAAQNMPSEVAEEILLDAADERPEDKRDPGWIKMRGDIPRILTWVYGKEADAQATLSAVIASAAKPKGNGTELVLHPDADTGAGRGGPPPPPPGTGGPGPGAAPGGPPPPPPGAGRQAGARGWIRDKRSRYAGCVANVITAFRELPAFVGCVAYDEMALQVVLRRALPGDTQFTGPRLWEDADTTRAQDFLQRHAEMARVSRGTVDQGVDSVAREHKFHPARDYLAAQQWDGVQRLDSWLTNYLGVEPSDYAAKTGRWWLIGLVARVMQPGCRADHMLILEGEQGTQKSQVGVTLCSPWVSDQPLDIRRDNRAASQHLRGRWLCEISELAFFRQADIENLKAFLTRPVERYLPRYAHREVEEPRQGGFIGTTNQGGGYLHDPTGGRRFWPHRTSKIDIEALAGDRSQIWAKALVAYRAGEHWWPPHNFEDELIQPEQAERYDADAWMELISYELDWLMANAANERLTWTTQPQPKPPAPCARTTLLRIWQAALTDFSVNAAAPLARDFDRSAQLRVREILQFLGWRHGERTRGARWWVEPTP
jgi:predicted P-loop ATPase